jgi:transcriptional regulator with XRE-family HTH domain
MAVTIKDVARQARVSVATVSRALNGQANVTPETRAHVLGVAAALRFVPSSAALLIEEPGRIAAQHQTLRAELIVRQSTAHSRGVTCSEQLHLTQPDAARVVGL